MVRWVSGAVTTTDHTTSGAAGANEGPAPDRNLPLPGCAFYLVAQRLFGFGGLARQHFLGKVR